MNKHTPGPWGVIIGDAGPIVFSGNKGSMVATCTKRITSTERESNARLIAAAPELLEALQDMIDSVIVLDVTESERSLVSAAENAIAKARSAIAKATGDEK